MALFRRRSTPEEPVEPTAEAQAVLDDLDEIDAEMTQEPGSATYDRSHGPFDESEVDLADQDLPRLDLGSLRIPGLPGIGVQVEADTNTQEVKAITAMAEDGAVQLQVFAAPRSEGLWDELRAEMHAEIGATAGAEVVEGEGFFGAELRAVLPARTPEGTQVLQPVRFTGIDGPRWLLRAVFLGKAAVEPDPTDGLHQLVRETIVVRGPDARAPRDPLPLTLPAQLPDADGDTVDVPADEEPDEVSARYEDLDPFERGPEITETR